MQRVFEVSETNSEVAIYSDRSAMVMVNTTNLTAHLKGSHPSYDNEFMKNKEKPKKAISAISLFCPEIVYIVKRVGITIF